jgi:hypothetical protein
MGLVHQWQLFNYSGTEIDTIQVNFLQLLEIVPK